MVKVEGSSRAVVAIEAEVNVGDMQETRHGAGC
jgi:hypothetical protein